MKYAGIGSRKTPSHMLDACRTLGRRLALNGLTLRSGRAEGADWAFESGALLAGGDMEIFLPWRGFNIQLRAGASLDQPTAEAIKMATAIRGPMSRGVEALMARNCHQILGKGLNDPVDFVVCWTDPNKRGGTDFGIALARKHNIPVFNLGMPGGVEAFKAYMQTKGIKPLKDFQ